MTMESETLGASLGLPPGLEAPKGPGRPKVSEAQRALNDQKYEQTQAVLDLLPAEATDHRFKLFYAYDRQDAKSSFTPVETIMVTEWKEKNLQDKDTLASYIAEKHGDGRYAVEVYDAMNIRVPRAPTWYVTAGDPMSDDQDDRNDQPRGGRGQRRLRRAETEWEDDDDEPQNRANVADLMGTVARSNAAQMQSVAKSGNDLVSLMMMTQQQSAAARADEDRRREERADAERVRREEREAQRQEDKEERLRQEAKLEKEERERREEREERRRSEDADRRATEAARHLAEVKASSDMAMKRMEMMMGAVTAVIPVVAKLFEKKDDPILGLLLAKISEKPEKNEPDAMQMMLFKSILDKMNNDQGSTNMIAQMGEMMKLSNTMSVEQMKSMMAQSGEFNQILMKRALDLATANGSGDGDGDKPSMLENIVKALAGAGDIVKGFLPAAGAPQPAQPQHQRRLAQQPAPAQPGAPAAAPAAATAPPAGAAAEAGEQRTPDQIAYDQMTDEERARVQQNVPRSTLGVVWALYSLQQKQFSSPAEQQQITEFLVTEMPLNLRVAVLDKNEPEVMNIVLPFIQQDQRLNDWVQNFSVVLWVRDFVPNLIPTIEAIHGPADQQREQLVESLRAPPAPEPVVQDAPAPVLATVTEVVSATVVIPPTEQIVEAPTAPPGESGSHLDNPDEP
jgi:hypothetical protein